MLGWFIVLIILVAIFSASGRAAIGTFASLGCGLVLFIVGTFFIIIVLGTCADYSDYGYDNPEWEEQQQYDKGFKEQFNNPKPEVKVKPKPVVKPKPKVEPVIEPIIIKPEIEYQEEEE